MVDIPPGEKVIFKWGGLLRKAFITDKAVYKKGIISLERYDFNNIICMFCREERISKTYYSDKDYAVGRSITIKRRINMLLSNGRIVEFLSYNEGALSSLARTLGTGKTVEKAISEAIRKNLPPGRLLFYEYLPMPIEKIVEMIKENRSPGEIREELQRKTVELRESMKKDAKTPRGKAVLVTGSLLIAGVLAPVFVALAYPLCLILAGSNLEIFDILLIWLIFTALLAFPIYSRLKKFPEDNSNNLLHFFTFIFLIAIMLRKPLE
jgi:hypothetical protein